MPYVEVNDLTKYFDERGNIVFDVCTCPVHS